MQLPKMPIDATARRVLLVATDDTYKELTKSIDWSGIFGRVLDIIMLRRTIFQSPRRLHSDAMYDRVPSAAMHETVHIRTQSTAMNKAGNMLGHPFVRSEFFGPTVQIYVSRRKKSKGDWWIRHRELPMPHLGPVDAKRRFEFTAGHPIDGTVYGLLPSSERKYVPLALVDDSEKQHRIASCKALLGALGAKTVEVVSTESNSTSFDASVQAESPVGNSVGGHASRAASTHSTRSLLAEFGPPSRAPHLPEKHAVWLRGDPVLAALVENRLEHSLMRDSFTFEAGREAQVSGEMCAGLTKLGLKVGGNYKSASAETWHCEATFWPWPAED